MLARTSRQITRTYREIYFQCTEALCGATYVADLTIIRVISPSACPRPDVVLPMSSLPVVRQGQRLTVANDDGPPAANDDRSDQAQHA